MSETAQDNAHIELAVEIVSAYVSNNSLPTAELPGLIEAVHGSLQKIATGAQEEQVEAPVPAVAGSRSPSRRTSSSVLKTARSSSRSSAICATKIRHDAGRISRQMGPAGGLSDGCTELRLGPFRAGQGHGSRRPASQGAGGRNRPRADGVRARLRESRKGILPESKRPPLSGAAFFAGFVPVMRSAIPRILAVGVEMLVQPVPAIDVNSPAIPADPPHSA